MRDYAPRHRIEVEVVILLRPAARGGRTHQRHHKLGPLPGVVQQRRRHHVRRRLLRRLRNRRQANNRRLAGQCHQFVRHNNVFDRLQPCLVERQSRVARNLLLLQLADHVAVVRRLPSVFLRHLRGQRRHLRLDCRELLVRHRRQLRRRNIDSVVLQRQGILFRRQFDVGPRLGQHRRTNPGVVVRQLLAQLGEGFLPSGQIVGPEQLLQGVHVVLVPPQLRLYLAHRRIHHARLGHLLHHPLLQQVGERLRSRFHSRVLAQPDHRRRPPLRRHPVIQQRLQPGVHRCACIDERNLVRKLVVLLAKLQVKCLLQNLEVFAHILVFFLLLGLTQRGQSTLELFALCNLRGPRRVGNLGIVLRQPLPRPALRRILQLHIQQHLRVLVAARHPRRFRRGRCGLRLGHGGRVRGNQARGKHHRQNDTTVHRQISGKRYTPSIRSEAD